MAFHLEDLCELMESAISNEKKARVIKNLIDNQGFKASSNIAITPKSTS